MLESPRSDRSLSPRHKEDLMLETRVPINLSNRHIHVSREDLVLLFGTGHTLASVKNLIQPGQFACAECVTIEGPGGSLQNVRILGPERGETQCEILASDTFKLGVTGCPVRESGHLDGSFPFIIVGPAATIRKSMGLIVAKRHIHLDPESARRFSVADGQTVQLRVAGERGAILENVVCRVGMTHALECHLDFDEGNAVGIGSGSFGEIIKE
jgi:putative phosphotransacetylase